MTFPGHNPHILNWKGKTSAHKTRLKSGDINQWMKRVEKASEFAVSEVFSHKKTNPGITSLTVPLQSSEQLRHHDEAYNEAQALLSDWMNTKLREELEVEEDDDLMSAAKRTSPVALATAQPNALDYSNFDDLYKHLAEEEEHSTVTSFLQDLMEQEVSGMMGKLSVDIRQTTTKFIDPAVIMAARHQQVRENRARRDAERQRQQQERKAQQGAREEAKRRERERETRRRQEAHRQEEMMQQEMVRLRREMQERRGLEQMLRQREREKLEEQRSLQSGPPLPTTQQHLGTKRLHREEKIQTMFHMHNLKCLQRHFSGWYSVLLNQRIRLGKATALCDWRRLLRAWRAWRALVWDGKQQREVERTEAELRAENRHRHVAMESDRRRLLRRCLNEWQLWCRTEREQRELLAQQQETRQKMAALIDAASTGKLAPAEATSFNTITASNEAKTAEKEDHRLATAAPAASTAHQDKTPVSAAAQPTQPWQVRRRHATLTAAELRKAQRRGEGEDADSFTRSQSAESPGSRFEHRYAAQQHIITQQRRLLKKQQQQLTRLQEEHSIMGLELEAAQFTQLAIPGVSKPKGANVDHKQQSSREIGRKYSTPPRKAVKAQTSPHPFLSAMEERARQRAERRTELEELKRKKEDEMLAEMKAAEEDRQREEEEEKRRAAEKRREEKRKEKEREDEKQRRVKREKELMVVAQQHYHKNLIQRRGLEPWKRLLQLKLTNMQLAESHHNLLLLRRCTLGWQQSARESMSQREDSADQLHQHFLLRRSLSCWKRLRDCSTIQEQHADRFYRRRTLKRFLLALLEHVTQERLAERSRLELAEDHDNRRLVRGCFLAWRQFPHWLREEREKEERRESLRQKVADVLHDFRSSPLKGFWEKPSL